MTEPKHALRSKSVWLGVITLLASLAALLVEFWGLLAPEDVQAIRDLFGPEVVTFIGLLVLVLRALTTTPIRWRR